MCEQQQQGGHSMSVYNTCQPLGLNCSGSGTCHPSQSRDTLAFPQIEETGSGRGSSTTAVATATRPGGATGTTSTSSTGTRTTTTGTGGTWTATVPATDPTTCPGRGRTTSTASETTGDTETITTGMQSDTELAAARSLTMYTGERWAAHARMCLSHHMPRRGP